ncbi:hypothetical protein MOX02_60300 [Methylobacterium oxalidis]|uniref:Uncharacterized protein n=1 Tax=Methylobacterium oxalidis TaxID=944322 RepID=A0A512JDF3_9HYPH|nr:hypothetical protein MOX02_60300 [Methylobacterium oxalidis]GJE35928.1 hypothetical protein LDDCCGHA_6149 [Methylobacterium oxalidis]
MIRFAQGFLTAYVLAGLYVGVAVSSGANAPGFGRTLMVGAAWPILVTPTFVRREICASR